MWCDNVGHIWRECGDFANGTNDQCGVPMEQSGTRERHAESPRDECRTWRDEEDIRGGGDTIRSSHPLFGIGWDQGRRRKGYQLLNRHRILVGSAWKLLWEEAEGEGGGPRREACSGGHWMGLSDGREDRLRGIRMPKLDTLVEYKWVGEAGGVLAASDDQVWKATAEATKWSGRTIMNRESGWGREGY